jgi:thiol-disulfide isomerase/thioredoxin
MRHRIPLLIASLFAAVAACGGDAPPPAASGGARAPASLPQAQVLTLDGAPADLATAIHGRTAFVNLWATWCDACVGEIDAMKRLAAQTSGRSDALVVGVAVGETPAAVAAFARERKMQYLQLVDEDFRLTDALGQRRVPATLVVDRAGRIVYRGDAMDAAGLAAFRGAMGDAQAAPTTTAIAGAPN